MPFYEVIYETGAYSVAEYADEKEALGALKSHHTRATNGEVGGPPGHPAERIVKVFVYDQHPYDSLIADATGAHESNYSAKPTKELTGWQ